MKVKFKEWNCNVEYGTYYNGRTSIRLTQNGEQIAVATVNIPAHNVPDGHVLIKNWSENQGIAQALQDAGVIKLTGKAIPTGFVEALEAKLLIN